MLEVELSPGVVVIVASSRQEVLAHVVEAAEGCGDGDGGGGKTVVFLLVLHLMLLSRGVVSGGLSEDVFFAERDVAARGVFRGLSLRYEDRAAWSIFVPAA